MTRTPLALAVLASGSLGISSGCRTEIVTPVVASSVVVAPERASIVEGEDLHFTATVIDEFDQAMVQAVVTWSTSDRSIVHVDSDGRAWGLAPGTTLVWASFNGTSGSALMTVTPFPECGSDALAPGRKPKKKKGTGSGDDDGDDDDDDDEDDDSDDDSGCASPVGPGS